MKISAGLLTLKPVLVRVGCIAPVAQQLIAEAHHPSAPGSAALRTRLEVDGGPARTVGPETEHLLVPPPAVRRQQLQLTGPLDEHAGSAEGRRRLDADSGAPGGGQVGLEEHPQSLTRVDPPHRAFRTAQPHLQDDPGVHAGCKPAAREG